MNFSKFGFSNGQSGRFDQKALQNRNAKSDACIIICTIFLLSTTLSPPRPTISPANGRGHPAPPRTSASMQSPPSRGVLHGPDRSGRVACGRNKHIDQRQPQHTGGCPNQHAGPTRPSDSPRNMAWEFGAGRFMSRCSVQINSAARPCCAGCTNETTSGSRSLAVRSPGPIGAHNLGDDASLRVVTPPYTTGLIKGRSRSRSLSGSLHSPAALPSSPAESACLACLRPPTTPPYSPADSAFLACWRPPTPPT